ncbi:hypothetical protein ACI01nite_06820 [Acetobacter cibinongensis]|uniref:Uncharacterized protein n=1 Tax=Acetobacter cibinongensis TaxID=146475 RepID=A0A0D6N4D8_9PROT|nr:hypothetical protein Abci_011_106 [Acetobacter cibinongensis]GEL58080.1 hypothetical protein ACI01nite_06820 [Acetobacter cibinongensis]
MAFSDLRKLQDPVYIRMRSFGWHIQQVKVVYCTAQKQKSGPLQAAFLTRHA